MTPPGIFVLAGNAVSIDSHIEALNKQTNEWTDRAARGECSWICSDCCQSFPLGMPDACEHGHQSCTDIIQRDKAFANATGEKNA